eukprot:gene12639-2310_t
MPFGRSHHEQSKALSKASLGEARSRPWNQDLVFGNVEDACAEICLYRELGGQALIDCTTPDCGRDLSGFTRGGAWYLPQQQQRDYPTDFEAFMTCELMGEAACKACKATGAPLFLATTPLAAGNILEAITASGADPRRCVFCNVTAVLWDQQDMQAVLDAGAVLCFDLLGFEYFNTYQHLGHSFRCQSCPPVTDADVLGLNGYQDILAVSKILRLYPGQVLLSHSMAFK